MRPRQYGKTALGTEPGLSHRGIDLSQEMIALAKTNVPTGEFQQGDIRQLHFDRTFDAVMASFCIATDIFIFAAK